ncbi:MAG: PAS domain-containing protein [Archangium sp.]|nr:PAS domain-containing protein [Archangium sp.]
MPTATPLAPLAGAKEVLSSVDRLSTNQLDELPFGMIQLDPTGRILKFNRTEGRLARIRPERQVGLNFFNDVAPCTKVKEFHGRFVEGVARKQLYETFGFTFKFDHGWRDVAVSLMYSAATDSVWVLISQQEPAHSPT